MAQNPKDLRRVHYYITDCWDRADHLVRATAHHLPASRPDRCWMSIAEGRNRYRALIEEAVAAAVERRAA